MIPHQIIAEMEVHLQNCLPEEGCGILAGIGNQILRWFPITNIYHNPVRYRMDAQEQLNAFLEIEKQNWQLLAIVHSHPAGPPYPSDTDIAEAYYPESAYIIYAPINQDWLMSGYRIQDGLVKRITIISPE